MFQQYFQLTHDVINAAPDLQIICNSNAEIKTDQQNYLNC